MKTCNSIFLAKVEAAKDTYVPKHMKEKYVSFLIVDHNSETIIIKLRERK